MRVSRRSFLGGAVGSIGLLFGGFGWREEEVWEASARRAGKSWVGFYGNPQPTSWAERQWMTITQQEMRDWSDNQRLSVGWVRDDPFETVRTAAGDSKVQIWREV